RMNRGVDAVIGGWTVSSVMIFQSSGHLTPFFSSHCGSGTNCYTSIVERPDAVPGQDPNSGAKTTEQWFNTGAFTTQAFFRGSTPIFAGRFGNAGKGIIDGPGMTSIDVGAFKDFSIREGLKFRLQTQVRNFPNHPNFAPPETNLSSGNYGKIRE